MKKKWMSFGMVLLLGILLAMVPLQRDRAAADQKKLYALELTTGASGASADKLQGIVINYKDTADISRTYCIFPETALKESVEFAAAQAKNDQEYQQRLKKEETAVDQCKERLDVTAQESKFIPYTTQTLFFYPYYEMKTVESVKILTCDSASWTLQGMRLIQVDPSSVTQMAYAGVSSFKQTVCKGVRVAEMRGVQEMAWTSSKSFTIGSNSKSEVYIKATNNDAYQTYDSAKDDYVLKLDIADVYGAGLETLATESGGKVKLSEMMPADLLYASIYYEDIFGDTKIAKIPVISSLLAETSGDGNVIGLAQQGESVAISVRLPGVEKILTDSKSADSGIRLTLGMDNAGADYGISFQALVREQYVEWSSSGRYETKYRLKTNLAFDRNEKAKTENEALAVTGISLYQGNVTLKNEVSGNEVVPSITTSDGKTPSPTYYFTYKQSSGRTIQYGQKLKFDLIENATGSGQLKDVRDDVSNLYLVEITTANTDTAVTKDDIKLTLSYTTLGQSVQVGSSGSDAAKTGNLKTTMEYDVKEKVRELYGYWPATGSKADYIKYYDKIGKGQTLQFLISLSDVDTFTGASFSISGKDEWQVARINVSRVTSMGRRTVDWTAYHVPYGTEKLSSDRQFNRSIEGQFLAGFGSGVLVRGNKKVTITFEESTSVLETDNSVIDWDPTSQKLSYDVACANLGFRESKVTYNVDVSVAKAQAADSTNGDCGSKNLFYFRLNFESGSSAYVLANQQLSADGFRAGYTERFSVSMNKECGELLSVDIIPDDLASSGDVYDKLNIESIKVSRQGTGSLNRYWEISSPGWVGIDYIEDAVKEDSSKQTGRYEGELANNFQVDTSSYSVKLMFTISTGEYPEGSQPFSGTVTGELYCTSNTGETMKPITFDMVEEFYSYMQMTPPDNNGKCPADPTKMFRENHTDRFFLDIENVQSVDKLVLHVSGAQSTKWNIKNIGVSLVEKADRLIINTNDEYEYTGSWVRVTQQQVKEDPAYTFTTSLGSEESKEIIFDEAEPITPQNLDSSNATAIVSREPGGNRDTLNIFAFPKDASKISSCNMLCSYEYVDVYGGQFYNQVNTMNRNSQCFYTLGISARYFSQLKNVGLMASSGKLDGSHVIVQHLRNGVILGTYFSDSTGTTWSTEKKYNQIFQSITNQETQQVSLYFAGDTTNTALEAEKKDIAVSIGYKSELGDDDKTYYSPNVFLTDAMYKQLYSGMLADVDFHIPYVKEITEIRILGTGDVTAYVDSAVVATYTNDLSGSVVLPQAGAEEDEIMDYRERREELSKGRKLKGWYSFTVNAQVANKAQTFNTVVSDLGLPGTLTPVTLTMSAQKADSSTDTDMSLTLRYLNSYGINTAVAVPSVKEKMTPDSSFDADGTITLQFMLPDVKSFVDLDLKTLTTGTSYSIDTASISWYNLDNSNPNSTKLGTIETLSRVLQERVTTDGITVGFAKADIKVKAKVQTENEEGTEYDSSTTRNMNFTLSQGEKLKLTVDYKSDITGDGWSYELFQISGDTKYIVQNESAVVSVSGNEITVETEELLVGTYEIRIYGKKASRENEVVVGIIVKEKKQQEETQNQPDESESTPDETTPADEKKNDTEDGPTL